MIVVAVIVVTIGLAVISLFSVALSILQESKATLFLGTLLAVAVAALTTFVWLPAVSQALEA